MDEPQDLEERLWQGGELNEELVQSEEFRIQSEAHQVLITHFRTSTAAQPAPDFTVRLAPRLHPVSTRSLKGRTRWVMAVYWTLLGFFTLLFSSRAEWPAINLDAPVWGLVLAGLVPLSFLVVICPQAFLRSFQRLTHPLVGREVGGT